MSKVTHLNWGRKYPETRYTRQIELPRRISEYPIIKFHTLYTERARCRFPADNGKYKVKGTAVHLAVISIALPPFFRDVRRLPRIGCRKGPKRMKRKRTEEVSLICESFRAGPRDSLSMAPSAAFADNLVKERRLSNITDLYRVHMLRRYVIYKVMYRLRGSTMFESCQDFAD